MRSFGARVFSASIVLGFGLAGAAACSATNRSGGAGLHGGGDGNTGAGASSGFSTGSSTGNAATGNIDTMNSNGGNQPTDGGCQHIEVNFVPKIPTVFVLVDRSGSMFTASNGGTAPWEPLKTGALQVIQELQAEVAFGWGAFTGINGGTCPVFDSVAPALNNFTAINAVYQPLGALPMAKAETPVAKGLAAAQSALMASPVDGDKYILFVTDGEPDFCDDGDSDCPLDDVVYSLQSLKAAGTSTIVFGLQNSNVPAMTLQSFANAGAGDPVALPFSGDAQSVYYACQGVPGWLAERTAAAKTGMDILGTYTAVGAGGAAKYYQPDPADQDALTTQLRSVLSGVKSCTFDLGGQISVNLDLLSEASVAIEGQPVPLSPTDGWNMTTDTQLELTGTACATWRKPETKKIDFNFPCDIIVPK
jgi:hypothetical protein